MRAFLMSPSPHFVYTRFLPDPPSALRGTPFRPIWVSDMVAVAGVPVTLSGAKTTAETAAAAADTLAVARSVAATASGATTVADEMEATVAMEPVDAKEATDETEASQDYPFADSVTAALQAGETALEAESAAEAVWQYR